MNIAETCRILWCLCLSILLFTTCQSLEDLYAEGDYDKSFKAAERRLNKKPEDAAALTILEQSLDRLISANQTRFTELRRSSEPGSWESALDVVAEMDELLEQARVYLPDTYADEQPVWWADALALEEQLYIHYLDRGKERLLSSQDAGDAGLGQQAYADFTRALHYRQSDFPEQDKLPDYQAQAEQAGTIYYKVAIDDGFNVGLMVDIDGAFDDLDRQGRRFLSVEKVFIANDGDCAIDIDFGEFETRTDERQDREDFTTSVVIRYETEVDTSGNETEKPVYGEVSGWVETVTNTKVAEWSVDVDVKRRSNNCDIFSESYTRTLTSEVEFYRVGGDERAIPDGYRDNDRPDEHPDDDEMAEELLEELVNLIYRDYF